MGDLQPRNNGMNGSPEAVGSNEVGRGRLLRADRSRRSWSDREDEILVAALKELVANGWKSDNGFRAGYLTRIEETIKAEFPKSDLKAYPHINSKITTWKKNYSSLTNILNRSGVGFNINGDFKIDCDDEQWLHIVQKDGNARYMRNKSWPYFEAWKEIFGKDRAEGGRAADTGEAVSKIYGAGKNVEGNAGADYMTFEELFPDEVPPEGFVPEVEESMAVNTPTTTTVKPPKKAMKKRKLEDQMDGVLELMKQMHEDTNAHLKALSARIGYEFDLSTKRAEVFEMLKVVPGLTMKQQFYACNKMVKETELMDVLRGLSEVARPAYVMYILEEDGMLNLA